MVNNHEFSIILSVLPRPIRQWLESFDSVDNLVEIVLDKGRNPQLRFYDEEKHIFYTESLEAFVVEEKHLKSVVKNKLASKVHSNHRLGLKNTLHRVSVIYNLDYEIIGLTIRIGRIIEGTLNTIIDLVASEKSILLIGRPGSGKTSKLREASRFMSTEMEKRVVIVDTSNEIAGEGDVPHPFVGNARRLMVPETNGNKAQERTMIEAVENHMPEVIVVDEISTEKEAYACRTIVERGVLLLATAHGDTLENVVENPRLKTVMGGVNVVTLSDHEAKKRELPKTCRERAYAPVFDVVVELCNFDRVKVHHNVEEAVDSILNPHTNPDPEYRQATKDGGFEIIDELYNLRRNKALRELIQH